MSNNFSASITSISMLEGSAASVAGQYVSPTRKHDTGRLASQSGRDRIYTEQQIEQLLAAAFTLPPAGGLRRWTYHCLLGLFTVTGLRLGEALSLKLDDIDLHENVLTIRGAKYGKSRLIPIHPSTRKVLVGYLQRRERFLAGRNSPYLFVSKTGNRLGTGDVHRTFYLLSRQIGLRAPSASHGPRLHDFRHNSGRWIIPAKAAQGRYFPENRALVGA